jgi:hypothetical protein
MTERSDLANLRALGEPRVHDWAGAAEPIGAGLVEWTRRAVGHDQALAVRVSLDICGLVTSDYPEDPVGLAPRVYVEHMLAVIRRWIERPTREHREAVRSSLDVTRERHAWQTEDDIPQFWTLEAVDHACLTVWAGERASYIIPVDFPTSAGRAVACAYHAMRSAGQGEQRAADAVIDIVLEATA